VTIHFIARIALSILFLVAGVGHFTHTAGFERIVPPYLPSPRVLVYVSGIFEILGALGILLTSTRTFAGWGLVALLVAVFPANIYMATANIKFGSFPPEPWMAWARLPLQVALIALVIWACELWPPDAAA
jgi:uncharacterized membrane protein